MKRTKLLLSVLASCLLAFVMVFAAACDKGKTGSVRPAPVVPEKPAGDLGITEGTSDDTKSLLGIEVVTPAKRAYKLSEQFSSSGMQVRVTYLNSTVAPDPLDPEANLIKETLSTGFTVDSSDFDNTRVGVYTIYVSYTYLGVTRTTSYTVNVTGDDPAYGGIVAKLASGKSDSHNLTGESVVIPDDTVAVYEIQANGSEASTPLAADKYDVNLYLGSKKIANNTASENGVYSLVVTLKEDATKQDFLPVYVVNPVTGISLIQDAAGARYSQASGNTDKMSGTWQYTLTYSNSSTKTIKGDNAGLSVQIDTRTVQEDQTATVTYAEKDAKGVEHKVTCHVTYTITEATGIPDEPLEINIGSLVSAETLSATTYTSEVQLGQNDAITVSVLASSSASVAVDSNKKSYEDFTSTHRLKLGGKGTNEFRSIKIETVCAVTVTVYMMSSSSSDSRQVGIWLGVFDPNPTDGVATSPVVAVQTVGGASLEKHVYEISAEGIYYLTAVSGGLNIYGIIVTPNV